MKFRKTRGKNEWTSPEGYTIEKSEFGFGLYNVIGPRDPKPPHWHVTVGGCSTLDGAKEMAARHAAGEHGPRP